MISDHKCTSKADMIAVFPGLLAMIQGEHTMQELFRTLQHLMVCIQLHEYSLGSLNLLYVCLLVSFYAVNTQELCPNNVAFPGDICDFGSIAEKKNRR